MVYIFLVSVFIGSLSMCIDAVYNVYIGILNRKKKTTFLRVIQQIYRIRRKW